MIYLVQAAYLVSGKLAMQIQGSVGGYLCVCAECSNPDGAECGVSGRTAD